MAEKIGKYEVVELIGRGGMGMILKARDPVLDRLVALKVISSLEITPELRARFYREAQACARLSHPSIVTIYDMGEDDGRLFIVMELLEGEELRRLIARRAPLALTDKLALVRQICEGLHYAHQKGVVHRDIKPANILLLRTGGVKILDFGIAHIAAAATLGELTRTGTIMGTLRYMAPEQVRGQADHRSDIFSVAAVSYELFGGLAPFTGEDPLQILEQLRTVTPPRLSDLDPSLPPELSRVVERAMQKDPRDRFADLEQMSRQLELIQRGLGEEPEDASAVDSTKPMAQAGASFPASALDHAGFLGRSGRTEAVAWEASPPSVRRAPIIAIGTGAAITAVVIASLYWLIPSTPGGSRGDKPAAVSNTDAAKIETVERPREPARAELPTRVESGVHNVESRAGEVRPPAEAKATSPAPPSPAAVTSTREADRMSLPPREQQRVVPIPAGPSGARDDAEQARMRMADARRAAERVAAVFFARKRFTEAQDKEREGMAALQKANYRAAIGLFAEARSDYQAAVQESAQEEERVRQLAVARTDLDQVHALVAARRQEALAAGADQLARDVFDQAHVRQLDGDGLASRKDLVGATRAYREAAERYGEAVIKARAARGTR
jgi:serine/threonine-protein kinase